jgi:predicted ATPase with chaperone activity
VCEREQYLRRLSGPVLDRIDLFALSGLGAAGRPDPDRLPRLRDQVRQARARIVARWGTPSAEIPPAELEDYLANRPGWVQSFPLRQASSLRSRHKIVRLAWSFAAWDGEEEPGLAHLTEAAYYRPEQLELPQTPIHSAT